MNVLSLFDGMSCGRIALDRAGQRVDNYYASEIDKHAINVSQDNWPGIIHLGDIVNWREWDIDWASIDLLIAGSPCQGFSFAGVQLAFDDPRSKLFFEFVDILNHIRSLNPNVKFLLENVKMKKEYLNVITDYVGVDPLFINSALLSAQSRPRYYWTNIDNVTVPDDMGIVVSDILEDDPCESFNIKTDKHLAYVKKRLKKKFTALDPEKAITLLTRDYTNWNGNYVSIARDVNRRLHPVTGTRCDYDASIPRVRMIEPRKDDKCGTLTTVQKDNVVLSLGNIRRLTPVECERLQTVPDGYTNCVGNVQRYKMIGNGWTVSVIVHILKNLAPVSFM